MIGWLIEALVASTALMLLVLLLRVPVRRAFGPDVAYALWALPVLRLAMPPLPASWREATAAPISAASETITVYVTAPLATAAARDAFPLATVLAVFWIAGSIAFLVWHGIAYVRFRRRLLDRQVRDSEIDGGIRLIETDAASGPLAFGVLRKYVAFPRDFVERYDQDERDLALAHELGHHARGDLIANWIALGVLALHWFNPVAWRAFRAFRADQEIANDARVLAGLSAAARHTYACAIVKSAHGPKWGGPVSAACHLHTIHDLKGRLKMLTTNKTSRTRLLSGIAAIAVLTLAGLGVTASGTQAAETVRLKMADATGMKLASFAAPQASELPAPPAPPAPPAVGEGDRDVATTTTTGPDGKTVKRTRIVIRDKDGKVRTETIDGAGTLADIPEISEKVCSGEPTKAMVVNELKDGKRRIIICSNRIEKAAADGAAMAANSVAMQKNAMQAALSGLQSARAGIVGNKDMSVAQRAEALKGIDEAIVEVTHEMNDVK